MRKAWQVCSPDFTTSMKHKTYSYTYIYFLWWVMHISNVVNKIGILTALVISEGQNV